MSYKDWKNNITAAAVDLLWSHWLKLGANATGNACHASADPEALLILTGLIAEFDLRLMEVQSQWLHHYESLVNVERLKTALRLVLEDGQGEELKTRLKNSLEESLPAGALKRWHKVLLLLDAPPTKKNGQTENITRKKLRTHDWILERNPLLGLRSLLGVTAKADILYFLGTAVDQPRVTAARPATGAHIARTLHYDPATVLRALEELKDTQLVRVSSPAPDKIYVLNALSPLFSRSPKADHFYFDWWALFPVFKDILSLDADIENRHPSVALDRLEKRLKRLDDVLAQVPRSDQKPFARENLSEAEIATLWQLYVGALYEISSALKLPRRLDWGSDELTHFMDLAQHNLWASYANLSEFRLMMKVDQIFNDAIPLLSHHKKWFEALFFLRCHSAYRAAVRLAGSGQSAEAFALLRAALENALYAFYIDRHKELAKVWMERKSDEQALKACRKSFIISNILKEYQEQDSFNGGPAKRLYDASIDHGAHPNVEAIFKNLEFSEDEKIKTILTLQLNTKGLPLKHAIINTVRTGICCLLIFEHLYKERFHSAGISSKIREFSNGL